MFVDTAMFEGGIPPKWVDCGVAIPFREERLSIAYSFVSVTGLTAPGKIDDRISGLRDGLEIGEAIAPTMALRTLLRTSRLSEDLRRNLRCRECLNVRRFFRRAHCERTADFDDAICHLNVGYVSGNCL